MHDFCNGFIYRLFSVPVLEQKALQAWVIQEVPVLPSAAEEPSLPDPSLPEESDKPKRVRKIAGK